MTHLEMRNSNFFQVVKTDGNYDLNEIPYAPLFSAKFPEFKFRATYDFDGTAIGYIKVIEKCISLHAYTF